MPKKNNKLEGKNNLLTVSLSQKYQSVDLCSMRSQFTLMNNVETRTHIPQFDTWISRILQIASGTAHSIHEILVLLLQSGKSGRQYQRKCIRIAKPYFIFALLHTFLKRKNR